MKIKPKIYRTVKIQGTTIPGIIWNSNYFFTDIEIYSDGLIFCWNMVDLDILKTKLKHKWVVPYVPDGKFLSIHNVGSIHIKNGRWLYNERELYKHIKSMIKEMNPEMENIFNCHGKDVKIINGVRYAWPEHGSPKACNYDEPITPFSEISTGDSTWLITKIDQKYYLTQIEIFDDETVRLTGTPSDGVCKYSEFIHHLDNPDLYSSPPIGSIMEISGLGEFIVGENSEFVSTDNRRGEIEDLHERIQGRPGRIQNCMQQFQKYSENPTKENRAKLKEAYEAVPDHLKIYCGDMDSKDIPIRMALYGNEQIENWSHYQVAKSEGMELPSCPALWLRHRCRDTHDVCCAEREWDYGAIQPSRIRRFRSVDAGRHDHAGRYVQSRPEEQCGWALQRTLKSPCQPAGIAALG